MNHQIRGELSLISLKRFDHFDDVKDSVIRYVESCLKFTRPEQLYWNNGSKINNLSEALSKHAGLVDLQQINNIKRINKHFEAINQSMAIGSYYITSVETTCARKKRILNKYRKGFRHLVYTADVLFHRLFAKLSSTRQFYFKLTNGKNRALSLTECMGRLTSCGFEIINYKSIGYKTHIVTKKVTNPVYDLQPTYGLFCRLNRMGKNGDMFTVYKLRTMHPYSEYLQGYIFEKNNLQECGKIKDDYRITSWGKVFRKFWIDELPMLYNWIRREMKFVGVRPLSSHYFSLYPEDVQQLRIKVKPGLIPPFYADLPASFEEIVESERAYLESYLQNPLRTDIRYFYKAMYNIVFKNARSM